MGGRQPLPVSRAATAVRRLPGLFDPPSQHDATDDAAPSGRVAPAPAPAPEHFTVSRLNERVREAIQAAFPSTVWLVGEISGFDKSAHRRHVSFELVERAEDGRVVSKIPAVVFATTRQAIQQRLRAAGDPFRLQDEIEVRLRVNVDLYVSWGQYRVVVEELDPNYTLGEAARRREEIVRRLTEAGLTELNRSLELPEVPLRLGLVTSLGSDAFNDVLRTLQESGFAFDVTAHGARVQGRSTEPSVLNALDWFRARAEDFDLILICRGGGARTDLVWFDSEALGRAVARFPLPVVVGIGHEQDLSVLDAVATSCKTPTAAAAFVVERVRQSQQRIETLGGEILARAAEWIGSCRRADVERGRRLARGARNLLRHERTSLQHRRRRAVLGARGLLAAARDRVSRWVALIPRDAGVVLERQRRSLESALRTIRQGARRDLLGAAEGMERMGLAIGPGGRRLVEREQERLEQRRRRLELVHPRRVLDRGYAILRLEAGAVLTGPGQAPPGSVVRAELRRGSLKLRSEGAVNDEGDDRNGEEHEARKRDRLR
jgi:exodeoxyribonuclease VII large subunit